MGLMMPVEHGTRIDVSRACRLVRALGAAWVWAGTYRPRTPLEIDRILAALVPDRDTTVTLEHGELALDALEPVAFGGGAAYTDVRASHARVRVWPDRAWLHVDHMPPGGLADAAAIACAHLAVDVPARAGKHVRGDTEVAFATPHLAIDVASRDREGVFRMFRAIAGPGLLRGVVMQPSAAALAALPRYVAAVAGTLTVDAELPPEVAAECATVPCGGWQIDDLQYDPESGLVSTYRLAPVLQEHVAEWTAKIDAALERT